jgi:hypothetical protein
MTRLWTYTTPIPATRWEHHGDSWRTTIAPTVSETPMDPDPHPPPATGDTAAQDAPDTPPPAATLADVDQLLANTFERWRLIQDLANSSPHDWAVRDWIELRERARRLVDETQQP